MAPTAEAIVAVTPTVDASCRRSRQLFSDTLSLYIEMFVPTFIISQVGEEGYCMHVVFSSLFQTGASCCVVLCPALLCYSVLRCATSACASIE